VRAAAVLSGASRHNRGFALIIVLWALVLIAFITAQLVANGRVEIRIAGNLVANAATGATADGAVYQAIFNLLDPQPERRWALDGTVREFVIGGRAVSVQLDDETARINPNLAPPALIEALLRVTGSDAETARRLAAAIAAWAGSPTVPRTPDQMLAEYRAAGLDYGPPGEPLETVDELQRVVGMTPAVFAAIRPHLSLFAAAEPAAAYADPVVMAAMAQAGIEQPGAAARADVLTARIAATAQGPNNARATRLAIVRVVPVTRAYGIVSWTSNRD
jgi:general secretion pathway protein K